MLNLTRKKGEIIKIGDSISVVVVDITDGKVEIGIAAPRDIPVHRLEVYKAIKAGESK